jgi:cytochrome c-type biogenesis protein CcmF
VLAFLVIVIGASLALYAWRAPKLGLAKAPGAFTITARESMLLANNILMVVAMLAVLLGTLYPLFLDALKLGKISVGPPYFDVVFYPLMAPALFLMAVGPMARWRNATLPELAVRLKWAAAVAVLTAILIPLVMGKWSLMISLGLLLAGWIVAASVTGIIHRFKSTPRNSLWGKITANSSSYYGMHVAHIGIAVFVVGVTMVKGFETERDVRMAMNEVVKQDGYEFKFVSLSTAPGPNYQAVVGRFEISKNGKLVQVLQPEKRTYGSTGQTMTEAAISAGITGDLYVSLGEQVENSPDGAWGVRIYIKPFIDWIWYGCLIMAFGGILALGDKRYRLKLKRGVVPEAAAASEPAPAMIPAPSQPQAGD